MTPEVATLWVKGIIVATMMANAIMEGIALSTAFKAMGRNPKLEETMFPKVIIGMALVESTAIYALVAFFTL